MRHLALLLCLSLLCFSCSSFGQTTETSLGNKINDGRKAYFGMDHERAYELFKEIWTNKNEVVADRTMAGRYLAKMDWLFYGNNKNAFEQISALEKMDEEVSLAIILRARILADEGKFDEAASEAKKAIEKSASQTERFQAVKAFVTHSFAGVEKELINSGKLSENALSTLREGYSELEDVFVTSQDNLDLARLRLIYSLLLKEGEKAYESWKFFNRVGEDGIVHPSLLKDLASFEKAIMDYAKEDTNASTVPTLIKGLAESGFYDYAVLIKILVYGKQEHPDTSIQQIENYHQFLTRLEKTILSFYQGVVNGNTSIYEFNNAFKEDALWLWDRINWDGSKPEYTQKLFIKEVRERFKALILFNTVSGYYGIHVGQVILDDTRMVNQHGYSAEFKYALLDHIVSNGYTSWFADGQSSVGGWASSAGGFVQVREGLNAEMINLWAAHMDPVETEKIKGQLERASANEEELARKNSYSFLPSLQMRLILRESKEVIDSLRSTGLDEKELRYAFISYMERIAQDAKIYAHEGRHSIDMKYKFRSGSADLEYTAKLSEIYFAEKPLFFLGTIMSSNMGNGTGHGDANLKLIQNLVRWMEDHQDEINGFDPSKPTQPQIDKLTDAQIKAAVKSLDPLAN